MYISGEFAPIFNLAQGTEQVDIHKIVELDYEAETAVGLLHSFAQNDGRLRIDSNAPERSLGIMFDNPAHFSNYPRTRRHDTQPWDILVHKETGFTAEKATEILHGEDLRDTRYIFPEDGLMLDQDGFSETLVMDTRTAEAIQSKGLAYHQYFHTPPKNAIRRWIGSIVVDNLNRRISLPARKPTAKPTVKPQPSNHDILLAKQATARICWIQSRPKVITYNEATSNFVKRNHKEMLYADWYADDNK